MSKTEPSEVEKRLFSDRELYRMGYERWTRTRTVSIDDIANEDAEDP